MKRLSFVRIAALSFILAAAYFAFTFTFKHLVKKQLTIFFTGSTVTVKSCILYPTHLLRLSGIEVKKKPVYNLKIKAAEIQYNLFFLFKGAILKLFVKEALIKINLPKKNISELNTYLNLKQPSSSSFLINKLEISTARLDIESKDLNIKADLSAQLNLKDQALDYLSLKAASINTPLLNTEDVFLNYGRDAAVGILNIKSFKYNKLVLEEIRSKIRLKNKTLFLDSLSAKLLGGQATGELNLRIGAQSLYYANLNFIGLNVDTFINAFDLEEKLQMSGKLNGNAILKGRQSDIDILGGDFSTLVPGGNLIIKDKKILENIASSSKEPLEIIVESFKNYSYNVGTIKMRLDKNNLIFNVSLEGTTGKRNLTATIYGLKAFLSANMQRLGINR